MQITLLRYVTTIAPKASVGRWQGRSYVVARRRKPLCAWLAGRLALDASNDLAWRVVA
jgi:hypothetical protein